MSDLIILANAKKHWTGPFDIPLKDIAPTRFHPIQEKIQQYLKLTTQPPEIVLSWEKPPYKILDGHHRFEVAKLKKQKTIKAYIYNPKK